MRLYLDSCVLIYALDGAEQLRRHTNPSQPASQPLRRNRKLADQALDRLNPTFCELYAVEGRPSVAPEQLLLNEPMGRVLEKLMGAPELKALLRDEPFSVDGSLTCSRWAPGSETLPTPWQLTSLSGAPLALRR